MRAVNALLGVSALLVSGNGICKGPLKRNQIAPVYLHIPHNTPTAHPLSPIDGFRAANEHLLRIASP
jgi:hypothetical protein